PGYATPGGESPRAARTERNRVFTPEDGGHGASFSMLSVDPSMWAWHVAAGSGDDAAETAGTGSRSVLRTVLMVLSFLAWAGAGAVAASTLGLPLARIDRKSTRLNSSHVSISYAVFCLKKKNNITHPDDYA